MSGHGINQRDLGAIAYLVARLRDETHGANTWDEAGIHAKLKPLLGQNLEITLERVLRHAADPEAKTPGAITRPFLPPAASEKAPKRGNPKRNEECPHHPGQWPDNCAGCKVETIDAYNDRPATRMSRDQALATARAALTHAKHTNTEEAADA